MGGWLLDVVGGCVGGLDVVRGLVDGLDGHFFVVRRCDGVSERQNLRNYFLLSLSFDFCCLGAFRGS